MTTQRFDFTIIADAQLKVATGGTHEMGLQNLEDQAADRKASRIEFPFLQNLSSTWII